MRITTTTTTSPPPVRPTSSSSSSSSSCPTDLDHSLTADIHTALMYGGRAGRFET
jgi:hypothetical protein